MTVPGIVRALERADSFRDAAAAGAANADFSLVDGLDAPLLAALLERRRGADRGNVLLVIAPTGRRAESLGPALSAVLLASFFPPAWVVRAMMAPLAALARARGHAERYAVAAA